MMARTVDFYFDFMRPFSHVGLQRWRDNDPLDFVAEFMAAQAEVAGRAR